MPSGGSLKVLSLYEGFFSGGARQLHTTVVAGLHAAGVQQHAALAIHSSVRREATLQHMHDDARYQALLAAGVPVESMRRQADVPYDPHVFSDLELGVASRAFNAADVVFSLKEQPLRLVNHGGVPRKPVVVALHRSDPENSGEALTDLLTAVHAGRLAKVVCCAESTRDAYERAGVPSELLTVVPNGVDLERFKPVPEARREEIRASLGVPPAAPVVLYSARYDAMKNPELFLHAARFYLAGSRHAHVLMCGGGMSTANSGLRGMIAAAFVGRPDLLQRLHLLGIRRDMPDLYAASDVVALTSSFGEAAPLSLIEGVVSGCVPVTTPVGDSPLIVDGVGFVTKPDAWTIASAWDTAVGRRAELAPALDAARERFGHRQMLGRYAMVLEDAALKAPAAA